MLEQSCSWDSKCFIIVHGKENAMTKILIGFIFGIIVATVGFSGIARMLDRGVDTVKTQSQEMAK